MEDVRDECSKFGEIIEIKIPRPTSGSRQSAGVGKIYVKYETKEATQAALKALAGRKFADRTVVTTYFPEVCFFVSTISNFSLYKTNLVRQQENFDANAW